MKLFFIFLYFLLTAVLLLLGIYWLHFHWFWAICFALSTSGGISTSINIIIRSSFAKSRLLRLINKNVEPERILQ